MNTIKTFKTSFLALSVVAAAVLAGCATPPANNAMLDDARADYRTAQANAQYRDLAPTEMAQASDALNKADAAFARHDDTATVNQLAYLAKQRVALATQMAERKSAEMAVTAAAMERDKARLAARTSEADAAVMAANAAQRDAEAAKRQADAARRQAEMSRQQSAASQMQAGDAERRAQELETQLRDLNAKKTERGMVVTIGDVLFDTDRADMKAGSARNVEKLVSFLKEYPQRKAVIEGFTDSTGGAEHNQTLSSRRAEAVRSAMVGMGVSADRLTSKGYGEAFPVAGNDNASGRQMNRRVEIVLSDENGSIAPR